MINKLTTKLSGMALVCISLSLFSQEKKEIELENYFGDLTNKDSGNPFEMNDLKTFYSKSVGIFGESIYPILWRGP